MKRGKAKNITNGKDNKRKATTIIVVALLLGAVLGYYVVAKRVPGGKQADGALAQEELPKSEPANGGEVEVGPEYSFDTFIVNIAETNGHRFLKCTVTVEFDDKAGVTEAEGKVSLLRDVIIDVLSSKTLAELDPGEPRDTLRKELVGAVNEVIVKANVKRVFFSEFVVQ